jgi:hypothetical protein
MSDWQFTKLLPEVREWALKQKRVTNKRLRDEFNFDEIEADSFYQELMTEGIIISGGYRDPEVSA